MASMKRLQEYLKGVCPLFADLDYREKQEFEHEMNQGDNPLSIYTDFRRHEIDGSRVRYVYWCELCQAEHIKELDVETDFVYIGSCPNEESPFKHYTSRQTCAAYVVQLRNTFGREPEGARLMAHYERGTDGYEVVCQFDTRYPVSLAYALMIENNTPDRWSGAAKQVLESLTGTPYKA